jgi:prephenate dehydrogenase
MRVAVVGLGLIGGSIALAARQEGHSVAAFDIDDSHIERGLDMGIIDVKAASLDQLVDAAEVVFVAVPIGNLAPTIADVLKAASTSCVVTDVGSLKRGLDAPAGDPRFVGGHPLAGAESAGSGGARADLFAGATWYLTGSEATDKQLYDRLVELIRGFGAHPVATTPELHDELMAVVSQLPHVLANVLVTQAVRAADGEVPATGPSFRDATRVAGSNTSIWADIYLANRDALGLEIEDTIAQLRAVKALLAEGDRDAIATWNDEAAAAHDRLRPDAQ